jgi:phage-related protein
MTLLPLTLQFGSYLFPAGFKPKKRQIATDLPTTRLPKAHGAAAPARAYLKPVMIDVSGGFYAGVVPNCTDPRASFDAMQSALEAGPSNLYLSPDRYYRAAFKSDLVENWDDTAYGEYVDVTVQFTCPDPIPLTAAVSSDTWLAPVAGVLHTIANGGYNGVVWSNGNAPATPVFTITLADLSVVNLTFTNSTTDESFTLSGTPTATSIVVDSVLRDVRYYGEAAGSAFGLFGTSIFPTLSPGVNALSATVNGGNLATVSSIGTVWNGRWWS